MMEGKVNKMMMFDWLAEAAEEATFLQEQGLVETRAMTKPTQREGEGRKERGEVVLVFADGTEFKLTVEQVA